MVIRLTKKTFLIGFEISFLFLFTFFLLSSCVSIEYRSLHDLRGTTLQPLSQSFIEPQQELSPYPPLRYEFEDRPWRERYYERDWYDPHNKKILLWIFEGKRIALTLNEAYDFVLRRSLECACPVKIELHKSKCYVKAKPDKEKFLWFRWKVIKIKSNCWEDYIYQY